MCLRFVSLIVVGYSITATAQESQVVERKSSAQVSELSNSELSPLAIGTPPIANPSSQPQPASLAEPNTNKSSESIRSFNAKKTTAQNSTEEVTFTYVENQAVNIPTINSYGQSVMQSQNVPTMVSAQLDVNCDLTNVNLPGDGKRAGIQAVTAARHNKLLQAMRDAKTDAEKQDAAKKLEENYRAHYASETEWRMKRIAEIEKRLEEMRSQVKTRETSEDKYVEAAVTLAKLYAQGIASEPPRLHATANSTPIYPIAPNVGGFQPHLPVPATVPQNAMPTFTPSIVPSTNGYSSQAPYRQPTKNNQNQTVQ